MLVVYFSLIGFILMIFQFFIKRKELYKDNSYMGWILFFVFYLTALWTSTRSVRLFMVFGTIIYIPIAYLNVFLWNKVRQRNGKYWSWLFIFIIVSSISAYLFVNSFNEITRMAFCDFNSIYKCGVMIKWPQTNAPIN